MTTFPSGKASHKAWFIAPVSPVKIIFVPLFKEYQTLSKFGSSIDILKFGAVAPIKSLFCGLLIVIIGAVTSFLIVTSANPIIPKVSFA